MTKRVLAGLCLTLVAAGAHATGVDINLSDQTLRGVYVGSLTDVSDLNGLYEMGALIGEEEEAHYTQGHFGLLVTGDAGAREANVIAGLGGRLLLLDAEDVTGGALAIGGMIEARLPAFNRIGAIAYIYGSPKASSFGDLEGHLEYALGLDYQVLRQASVYAGYRQVKVDVQDFGDFTVDNGWHLGLRLQF